MQTIKQAIIAAFPGKANKGLRAEIRKTLTHPDVLTLDDMQQAILRTCALTPKGEANLAALVKDIVDNGACWDLPTVRQ